MEPEFAKDYCIDHLISKRAINRTFNHFNSQTTKDFPPGFKPHSKPLGLAYGRPNPQYYPVRKITLELDDYPFQNSLFKERKDNGSSVEIFRKPHDPSLIGSDEALQYGDLKGLPVFAEFVNDLVKKVHLPAYSDWSTIATSGAGDGMNKVADVVVDPGDIVLVEEFTFTPFINSVLSSGGVIVPTKLNLHGANAELDIDYLSNLLKNWDILMPEHWGKRPKAIYMIPSCQNPTGLTQSFETRRKVYEIASIHDLVIIEDDPYGYLLLPPLEKPSIIDLPNAEITVEDFLENHLVPSYLRLDTQGRVIRIETFSKVFAPGLRLGFTVAHEKFINVIKKSAAVGSRSPSGSSQLILMSFINQKLGGIRGWLEWILKMRLAYAHRRNVLLQTLIELDAHNKGYFRVLSSNAGMFTSILINFPLEINIRSGLELLNYKILLYGVTVVLGINFAADPGFSEKRSNFLRLTYAEAENDAELKEAGKRLAAAIEEFFENGFQY